MPIDKTAKIWMDGELVDWDDARIHVLTHTLHYGSGVFEGIRAYPTSRGPAVFRLTDHMRRLHDSAHLLHMELPCTVNVSIAVWPWGTYLGDEGIKHGGRVKISTWRRMDPNVNPVAAKGTGIYINSSLAKVEALKGGYDEAVLLNTSGSVAEGTGENLFIVKNGALITPPLSSGALEGVTRDSVMTIARDLGYDVREQEMLRTDLYLADEAFLTGTAAEV